MQEELVDQEFTDEIAIHAVKWADTLNAFGAIAHLHPGYHRMRDDVEAGLRFHGLVGEPEVRLHELRRANLTLETFGLAIPDCSTVCSAIPAFCQSHRIRGPNRCPRGRSSHS